MVFVRKLVSICLHYNIVFKAKHIPGVHKKLVDALSRLLVHNCTRLAPAYMDPFPQGGFPVSAASELGNIVTMHASSSLRLSSIPTYKRACRLFHQFLNAVFFFSKYHGCFIGYMFDKQYAPSTVSSYVSA